MGRRYKVKKHSYVERARNGTFKRWANIGRSLSVDRRQVAKAKVKAGYGHQGDRKTVWDI
jgi:hypothetical protein